MRLLPAYFGSRRRKDDMAPPPEEPDVEPREDIFDLIPPRANENVARPQLPEEPEAPPAPASLGRNRHPLDANDLSRLSIDDDGRLYWDGKPVEVRRRLMMSPLQVVGATLIGVLVAVAALGAIMHGTIAAHDFACKRGLTAAWCPAPPPPPPQPPARIDIPA